MAATAGAHRTPLRPLESIALTLAELPEVAAEWEELPVDERLGWSLDWGNEMSKLEGLAHSGDPGALSSSDRAQYEEILRKLHEATPLVRRLGLRQPRLPARENGGHTPSDSSR
jgi:hypothetical protein